MNVNEFFVLVVDEVFNRHHAVPDVPVLLPEKKIDVEFQPSPKTKPEIFQHLDVDRRMDYRCF